MERNSTIDVHTLPPFQVSGSAKLITKICHLMAGLGYLSIPLLAIAAFFILEFPVKYYVSGGLILFVFLLPLQKILTFSYTNAFAPLIARLHQSDWVGVELEKSGNENKIVILPPDSGILVRDTKQIRLFSEKGLDQIIDIKTTHFKRVGKKFTCAVQCLDAEGNDLLGYTMTIGFKNTSPDVGVSGDKRYLHFLRWLGKRSSAPPLPNRKH